MLNDLLTLARIREGDIKAFEDVFRRYYSPLCWYAMSITGSMEAAEEIVEELFYGFWRDRERLPLFRSMKSTSSESGTAMPSRVIIACTEELSEILIKRVSLF